jgi:hypothetical protein
MSNRIITPEPSEETISLDGSSRTETENIAVTMNGNQRFKIPGDVIAKTCAGLPDDQRHAIKWAAGYCRERNITCAEFGNMLTKPGSDNKPYSSDSVYHAFTGGREAGQQLEPFTKAVHSLRRRLEETAPRRSTKFIETDITRAIFASCRAAFLKQRISFIFGDSQIGKSISLDEYARLHNHGETKLITIPSRPSFTSLLGEFAIRLGISTQNRTEDLKRRIMECFDERTLLIVDECERCVTLRIASYDCLDFLRELWDRRKCGMILAGSKDFQEALASNYRLKKLWRRGYRPLQLPSFPGKRCLNQFAEAFGLPPAPDEVIAIGVPRVNDQGDRVTDRVSKNPFQLQNELVKAVGVGQWLMLLEDAADSAKENGASISWKRVIAAWHLMKCAEIVEAK